MHDFKMNRRNRQKPSKHVNLYHLELNTFDFQMQPQDNKDYLSIHFYNLVFLYRIIHLISQNSSMIYKI